MAECDECGNDIVECPVGSHWHHVNPPSYPHFPKPLEA
jgi:hypothetical protein